MNQVTVSLAQMNVKDGDPRKNWATMQALVEEAARRGTEMVIFPELWDNGYALEKSRDIASPLASGLFAQITAMSRNYKMVILGSMLEKRGVGVYNSMAVFTPQAGVLGVYRKIHLFAPLNEPDHLTPGEVPLSVDLPFGTMGCAICYDLRFPEMFRRYFLDGAKVIVIPAQWPAARIAHWRALLIARAIENQAFVIGCNRVGEYNGTVYGGHSMIVDPWGEVVIEAGLDETMLTVRINLDLVAEVQQRLPVAQDRRPNVYGI